MLATLIPLALLCAAPDSPDWNARLDALVSSHASVVHSQTLTNSTGGKPIRLISISTQDANAHEPRGILLVAGADPRHRIGVEAAIGLAEKLATTPPEWLQTTTLYIVPCLNPDAFAYPGPKADSNRLRVSVDADHDGRVDEDGGEDLNGDGFISMMRVKDPAPSTGLTATFIDDPDNPGAMKTPDATKGERAVWALVTEGIDNDGDGQFNEDGVGGAAGGGIDLDMQWPSFWPEFKDGAGKRPLQTPETLELCRWCVAHPEISSVIVYGRHDTLVSIPEAGRMDPSNQVPLGIENDDKPVYELISGRFKEITGMNEAPKFDLGGTLLSWAYTNLGVPTLGTPVWVRPDLVKPEKRTSPKVEPPADAKPDAKGDAKSDAKPADGKAEPKAEPKTEATQPASPTVAPPAAAPTEQPATRPAGGPPAGGPGGPGGGGRGGGRGGRGNFGRPAGNPVANPESRPQTSPEDGKWVKYFNERTAAGGEPGFLPWKPFKHPQLGDVEIGGFIPGSRLNPPADEIPKLVDQQLEFINDFASKLPVIEHKVWATRVAPGVWRVELRVTNTGRLPTHLAIENKARTTLPTLANLDVDVNTIQAGRKIQRAEVIAPNGGTFDASWTVKASDGATLKIKLTDPQMKPREIEVPLTPSTPAAKETK